MKPVVPSKMLKKTDETVLIFGLPIFSGDKEKVLIRLHAALTPRTSDDLPLSPTIVFTPNPEQVVLAHDEPKFVATLKTADILVPDGLGLVLAARVLGTKVKQRITGIDLAEDLLAYAAEAKIPVLLVGGRAMTAKRAVERLSRRFDGLRIEGLAGSPDVSRETPSEWAAIERQIAEVKPRLVLVAFGAPKQEAWVLEHRAGLGVGVVMVVGGAVDVWAGVLVRAPEWIRQIGLEWLWRLGQEPWRWRRQLALVRFVGLIVSEWWRKRQ